MMQQRHFEAIAQAISGIKQEATIWNSAYGQEILSALPFVTERLADMCSRNYQGAYSSNRTKFLKVALGE